MKPEIFESSLSKRCLVAFLLPKLRLGIAGPWPLSSFCALNVTYKPLAFGDGLGFYDWLRDLDRRILGVRLWPFDLAYPTLASANTLDYVEVEAGKNISIHFVRHPQVASAFSCDQDFLYSALFGSERGDLAVAFGLEDLTAEETGSLRSLAVDWVALER